jgi:hypothetical protein
VFECNDEESQVLSAQSLVNQYVDLDFNAKRGALLPPDNTGPSHLYLGASVWVNQYRLKWLPWHPGKLSTTMLNTTERGFVKPS